MQPLVSVCVFSRESFAVSKVKAGVRLRLAARLNPHIWNTSIKQCPPSHTIDISMNHDLVEMFREKLDNFTISDYHGLKSPGLTCYLNSVLQVLFMTEDFREAVKQCCSDDSSTIDPHLGQLFSDLQKRVAKTHNITKQLGITNVYEQRDAAEYFEKLLCRTSPEAAMMFKGELNHHTTCLECKERSDSRSYFWILPLAVEDSCRQTYSVERGLKALFKGERVCGDNKMYCNRCSQKQDADLGCEITQHPDILTLLLKRFSFDYRRRCYVKLYCKVKIPQTLHMENCTYDLYALVNHFGNLTGGHYTAQIKSFETEAWYHFNDDIVERVRKPIFGAEDKSLRSCTAYLLMYRKVSRNREKKAPCIHPDVEAEGRHDEPERGGSLVCRHQLTDESCKRGETLTHLNGDLLMRRDDDMFWKKLRQTNTEADGDSYKSSLKTKNSAKLQKDGGQKRHERNTQLDTNSKEHMQHLRTRGTPTVQLTTHNVDCTLKPNHEPQKKIRKTSETVWETQTNVVAKTGTKTTSVTDNSLGRNKVKPAVTKVGKNKMEAVVAGVRAEGRITHRRDDDVSKNRYHSDVKTFHMSLQSQCSSDEPTKCNCSPTRHRKSHSSERVKERMQRPTASPSKRSHDRRDPWK
ncbi:uncharacterized protein [Pagrus major]|uniref:uncharacterized protein isoform X1 n=1 Tax=Pagrus major TaxID=143350 RepID=UPI003CC88B19